MNNSSAYNNVLLKPSVQTPAAQAPVSKRNYQDDQSSVSFQQSLKEVRDAHAQDEKAAKPLATKKVAQADNRKPNSEIDKKSPAPTKTADENRTRDQVAENKKTTDTHEHLETQNPDAKSSSENETQSKDTAKKLSEDEELGVDPLVAEALLVTNVPAPIPQAVALPVMSDAALMPTPAETESEVTSPAVIAKVASANEILSESLTVDSDVAGETTLAVNLPTTTANIQTKTDKRSVEDADVETATSVSEADSLIAQPLATDNVLAPIVSALDMVAEQAPAVTAALGSAVLPKPALTQAALTPIADDSSDSDALSTLINPLATERAPSKATVTNELGLATRSDASPAQAQVQGLDVKSTFEKTLLSMILPSSSKQEDNTILPAASQTSSTTSSTNTLDSMLRFNDAQTPAARSFVAQTSVPVPVGQPQWSQAVGEKVLWLAAQNVSSAEIHLNPENLGPVQVKVSVNQEQATINFTSHHAMVREVLDQNLGRLRDMFSEQGLNLVNVDVSDKSFSRQQGDAKDQKGQAGNSNVTPEEDVQAAVSAIVHQRLVDHYA